MASKSLITDSKILINSGKRLLSTSAVKLAEETRTDIEKVTHTGQVFDRNDYRNARFVNAKRYVNDNWGIKLIAQVPPKEVSERVVACDGGHPHLGHPKIYINLDPPGPHACIYCGLRYVKKDDHH